ncbi:hypothetical protein [Paracoccus zhejiangensis]|uniref:hypothetical protein n=1 Tax=Paracoccus zhejiangensis TaxID=1077935 RepID=UPI0018E460F7|nr:hypothetical protein [Paracoccus zhejiangensis]
MCPPSFFRGSPGDGDFLVVYGAAVLTLIRIGKALHAQLRRAHPESVFDPAPYAGRIRARSEIYDASLTPRVLALLDAVEAQHRTDGRTGRPVPPQMAVPPI